MRCLMNLVWQPISVLAPILKNLFSSQNYNKNENSCYLITKLFSQKCYVILDLIWYFYWRSKIVVIRITEEAVYQNKKTGQIVYFL